MTDDAPKAEEAPVLRVGIFVPPEYQDLYKVTDKIAAPLYEALGKAFARWQDVEFALFMVAHAVIDSPAEVSSTVFFHIKSQDSKAQLCDKLWRLDLHPDLLQPWVDLHGRISRALETRNKYAHYETAWLSKDAPPPLSEITPPIILLPHHLDYVTWKRPNRIYFGVNDVEKSALQWQELMRDILAHVLMRFSIAQLRIESLRPEVALLLASIQERLQPHDLRRSDRPHKSDKP